MALKPTIYKAQIALADSDRHRYESMALTLAQHPSETAERLWVRLAAFCLNQAPGLAFTRGISTADEPDLWRHDDSGVLCDWIEVGQPDAGRLRKASGRARRVAVYAFAANAGTWWHQQGEEIATLPRVCVWRFDWQDVQRATALLLARTMQLSVGIAGGVMYFDGGGTPCQLEPLPLARSRKGWIER